MRKVNLSPRIHCRLVCRGRSYWSYTVSSSAEAVMTRNPVSVTPQLPLSRLLQKLVEMRTKSLPVAEDGRLVGIVAREDVLKALRRATIKHEIPVHADEPQ